MHWTVNNLPQSEYILWMKSLAGELYRFALWNFILQSLISLANTSCRRRRLSEAGHSPAHCWTWNLTSDLLFYIYAIRLLNNFTTVCRRSSSFWNPMKRSFCVGGYCKYYYASLHTIIYTYSYACLTSIPSEALYVRLYLFSSYSFLPLNPLDLLEQ